MSSTLSTCNTCVGYGLWAMGDPVPIYRMDAMDGFPTIPCPECGANQNPVDKDYVPPTAEDNQRAFLELMRTLGATDETLDEIKKRYE